MSRTITTEELKQRSSEFTVIDVRRKTDYDGKTILNAERHNPNEVGEWAKDLPTGKEIVLYCAREGSVSNKVLDSLLAANIQARYIEGGIEGWKQNGGMVSGKKLP
jgi:Fe-Mn family superoxide dismutase